MNSTAGKIIVLSIGVAIVAFAGYAVAVAARKLANDIKPSDPWAEANR